MVINFLPFSTFNSQAQPTKNKQTFSLKTFNKTLTEDKFEKSISFTGLSNDLGKKLYEDAKSISEASFKNPKSSSVVGNIPQSWVCKIPPQERKQKIQALYSQMGSMAEGLRNADFKLKATKKAEKKLTAAFKDAGIISKKAEVSIKMLERGSSGYGYLIEGMPCDKKYVMKIYHTRTDYDRQTGPSIEINRAMYWKKNAGSDTQRAEFFFGDIDSGYMITEYVDANSKPPRKVVNPLLLGIIPKDDMGDNKIGNHYIDYGYLDKYGTTVDKDKVIELQGILSESKNARFAYKKVYNAQNKDQAWQEIYEDKLYKNKSGIKAGLVLALDFLDNPHPKYMEIYNNSSETKNANDYYLLKKALAQKVEYAPKEKIQDCCKELLMSGEEITKILKNKIHYIEDEKIKEEIKKTLDDHSKMFDSYQL